MLQRISWLIFSPKSIGSIYSEIMALSFVSPVHGPSVLAGWWASICRGKIGCWVKQCINVTPFCCSYMSFYNPFWVTKDAISKQVVIMTSNIYRHKAQAHTDGRAGNLWMPRGPATWTGASWMKDWRIIWVETQLEPGEAENQINPMNYSFKHFEYGYGSSCIHDIFFLEIWSWILTEEYRWYRNTEKWRAEW